jgi:hypothetical protein
MGQHAWDGMTSYCNRRTMKDMKDGYDDDILMVMVMIMMMINTRKRDIFRQTGIVS